MRDRILAGSTGSPTKAGSIPCWRGLRDHLGDVAISTIDAFCLSLLRGFRSRRTAIPVRHGDETEAARLADEALDRTMRTTRALASEDRHRVCSPASGPAASPRLSDLLDRRLVATDALGRAAQRARRSDGACRRVRTGRPARDALGGARHRRVHPDGRCESSSLQAARRRSHAPARRRRRKTTRSARRGAAGSAAASFLHGKNEPRKRRSTRRSSSPATWRGGGTRLLEQRARVAEASNRLPAT